MRVLSLFSGIGGFDLGLERAGMEIVGQVEIDEYCQRVLAKHWPDVKRMGDIHDVRGDEFGAVDLVCGGPPCQPVSSAGRRKGEDDARWLWPEMVRVVLAIRPRYALMENPLGLFDQGRLGIPLGELAAGGYDAEWDCIPAAAVGAHHLRDRVWILAYPRHDAGAEPRVEQAPRPDVADPGGAADVALAAGKRLEGPEPFRGECHLGTLTRHDDRPLADAASGGCTRPRQPILWRDCAAHRQGETDHALPVRLGDIWRVEPDVGRVAHGVPHRVDRLRGLGNAVVPQVVTWIGERIMAVEAGRKEAQR